MDPLAIVVTYGVEALRCLDGAYFFPWDGLNGG